MNKYQRFPEVKNWNGKSLGSDGIIYCDDCQSSKTTCQICGNCSCDGYPCEHQPCDCMDCSIAGEPTH